jgi:photosystem II PsbU protein
MEDMASVQKLGVDTNGQSFASLLLALNPPPTLARRNALAHGAALLTSLATTAAANAKTLSNDEALARPPIGAGVNDIPDSEVPASQMAPVGKVDVNNAAITDYKQFPGMFPRAAGLIASHGPYDSVRDIFKIPEATENDKKMFKQYAKDFIALPPSRMFIERLNGRVST